MRRDWYHRTKVWKTCHDGWWWKCLNPNCLTVRSTVTGTQAFSDAEIHTWVGGYRNTDGDR